MDKKTLKLRFKLSEGSTWLGRTPFLDENYNGYGDYLNEEYGLDLDSLIEKESELVDDIFENISEDDL